MAESTSTHKLILTYATEDGEIKHTYNYADPSADTEDIKAAMQAEIENGSIFAKVPTAAKDAAIVTTITTYIEI